jgi:hypothetical protein
MKTGCPKIAGSLFILRRKDGEIRQLYVQISNRLGAQLHK